MRVSFVEDTQQSGAEMTMSAILPSPTISGGGGRSLPPQSHAPTPFGRKSHMMAQARGKLSQWRGRRDHPGGSADEALVASLYAEHGRVLLGYTTKLTGDRQLAEDVVQETLLRAWRNAARLTEEQGSVRGWLLTVARNIVTDRVRARQARPAEVAENPAAPPVVGDHADDVVNSVLVRHALQSLSPEHRAVLVSVYYGGKTAVEAGEELGIPPGTVKSRSYYALRALRNAIEEAKEVTA
jgi:RNA polymerase sigma-70 factor, ECF subfamily